MAPCKRVKREFDPVSREVRRRENPDSIMSLHPSWSFARHDKEGRWAFSKDTAKDDFWDVILPKMLNFETMTWSEILISSKKQNHSIAINELNKCAIKRMEELGIAADDIVSLRLDGSTRLYGFLSAAVFVLLWYDTGHGDNDTCVCRSTLKHT